MRRLLRAVLITSLLCLSSLTFAESIFDVSGTLAGTTNLLNGTVGSFSGSIDINTQTGTVTNWSISIPVIVTSFGGAGGYTLTSADSQLSVIVVGPGVQDLRFTKGGVPVLSLTINGTTLQQFTGSPIIYSNQYQSYFIFGDGRPFYDIPVTAGSLTEVTPEPSTLILMGSGLVGMLGFWRKLFRADSA